MCGIAYTSFTAGDLPTMRHRGPDNYVRVPIDRGELHHALLAINGLQPQPIEVPEGLVVYNGEVYGVDEDASAMAEGFTRNGEAFLRGINGDWAFLYATGSTVMAVRDRFGLHSLFRYCDGKRLIYASNIATIREALWGEDLDINPVYSPKGRVPIPCYYTRVVPLPAGIIETATRETNGWRFTRSRWYTLHARNHGDLDDLIADAVRVRLCPQAVLAVSGGIDSYLIAAHAPQVPRYHLDVTGEGAAAERLNAVLLQPTPISQQTVNSVLEQPFYATPPNLFLAQAMRAYDPIHRVVLTGLGADEIFGGYRHHDQPFTRENALAVYGVYDSRCSDWRTHELTYSIPFHYGYRTDQAFLRYGFEARHPYMDHRVVETALCQPTDSKAWLRSVGKQRGWVEQAKKGFAADLTTYVQ